jgi:hypothetical protein
VSLCAELLPPTRTDLRGVFPSTVGAHAEPVFAGFGPMYSMLFLFATLVGGSVRTKRVEVKRALLRVCTAPLGDACGWRCLCIRHEVGDCFGYTGTQ